MFLFGLGRTKEQQIKNLICSRSGCVSWMFKNKTFQTQLKKLLDVFVPDWSSNKDTKNLRRTHSFCVCVFVRHSAALRRSRSPEWEWNSNPGHCSAVKRSLSAHHDVITVLPELGPATSRSCTCRELNSGSVRVPIQKKQTRTVPDAENFFRTPPTGSSGTPDTPETTHANSETLTPTLRDSTRRLSEPDTYLRHVNPPGPTRFLKQNLQNVSKAVVQSNIWRYF